jgi:hypothetical protein
MNSATPDDAALVVTGGGDVRVEAGGNLVAGQYYAAKGSLGLRVGGSMGFTPSTVAASLNKSVGTVLALGDAQASVQATGDVNLQAIVNPTLLPQSYGSGDTFNTGASAAQGDRVSVFSTYGSSSRADLQSLSSNVNLQNSRGGGDMADLRTIFTVLAGGNSGDYTSLLNYLPPQLASTAYQGNVNFTALPADARYTQLPSASSKLDVLAANAVVFNASLTLSDRDPALIPSAVRPSAVTTTITGGVSHAATPVHQADSDTVHIYARSGDVQGVSQNYGNGQLTTKLNLPKAVSVRAGKDIKNLNLIVQQSSADDRSTLQAGRDVVYDSAASRTDNDGVRIAGPGQLEVSAGRDVNLGTSAGIVSVGNLDNANLASGGADLLINAGLGAAGLDYAAAVERLLGKLRSGASDTSTLWQARWLTGNTGLSSAQAVAAVQAVQALDDSAKRARVREMIYTGLRSTGRDSNSAQSGFGGNFQRGYDALELVFPGIAGKNSDGSFANYAGEINLFASRLKTAQGGSIAFMNPGGNVVVGLANTPAALVDVGNNVLGMVVAAAGDIKGFSRGDMLVNQSRMLTVGGGDVMLWSSEGGIDAGKGKKTASAVPPPVIKVDAQGNVTQELQGAASGSGIGALSSAGIKAGDVDLIAPKGTVDAGDAGIRAGNLNVAALTFKGADNVSVAGASTGVPVADTSAVTAAASGATSTGEDSSKSTLGSGQAAAESARAARALAAAFKPSVVRVDVIGFGE